MPNRGNLITFYGINRLGKTTQADLLVERLQREFGVLVEYLKYPRYHLLPTGPRINAYLRGGNPDKLSAREFQLINIANRTQVDHELRAKLESGTWVVAEDYVGTGVAWGMAAGVDRDWLIDLNTHLVREDVAILFDGTPFVGATEKGHLHEEDDSLSMRARRAHLELQKIFGWPVVKVVRATEDIDYAIKKMHSSIWAALTRSLAALS